jgi:hypothetical protein
VANKFNVNDARGEVKSALDFAALLSECERFAEISGTTVGAAALAKIILGPHAKPWEGGGYKKDELEEIGCEAHVFPAPQNSKSSIVDDGSFSAPIENGNWHLVIRRVAFEDEIAVADGNDLYMWFWNQLCQLEFEIMEKMESRESPKLLGIERNGGPAYGLLAEKPAQGEYLWAQHVISWGESRE